jgi:hypothetical protein
MRTSVTCQSNDSVLRSHRADGTAPPTWSQSYGTTRRSTSASLCCPLWSWIATPLSLPLPFPLPFSCDPSSLNYRAPPQPATKLRCVQPQWLQACGYAYDKAGPRTSTKCGPYTYHTRAPHSKPENNMRNHGKPVNPITVHAWLRK